MQQVTNYNQEVKQFDGVVLVKFSATWCGPCKSLAPHLDALATEYTGKVKFLAVDVDDNGDAAAQEGIKSVPTVLIYKNKDLKETISGFKPRDVYKKAIDALL